MSLHFSIGDGCLFFLGAATHFFQLCTRPRYSWDSILPPTKFHRSTASIFRQSAPYRHSGCYLTSLTTIFSFDMNAAYPELSCPGTARILAARSPNPTNKVIFVWGDRFCNHGEQFYAPIISCFVHPHILYLSVAANGYFVPLSTYSPNLSLAVLVLFPPSFPPAVSQWPPRRWFRIDHF